MDVIYFYSNYSKDCKLISDAIKQNNLNFRFVCVDKKIVKNKISKKISYVPCIFVIHKNGMVEQYEGERCVNWMREILNSVKPKTHSQPSVVEKVEDYFEEEPPKKEEIKEQKTSLDVLKEEIPDTPNVEIPEEYKGTIKPPNNKQLGIVSRAQELQKERDKETETKPVNHLLKQQEQIQRMREEQDKILKSKRS